MSDEEMPKCSKIIQRKLRKSIALKGLHGGLASKNGNCTHGRKTKTKIATLKDELHCLCQKHPVEHYTALKEILPGNYDYRVCSFSQDGDGFKVILRLPYLSPEKAQEWKTQLENVSSCIFRICRTFPGSGRYNVFKMDYACQHNTSRGTGKLATKKTGCKAELSLTVKRVVKKSRSRDKHLPEYPTCIFVRWCHNHPLDAAQSLRYRDVGEDTVKELIALYHRGYTPASAYSFFKSKLMDKWGNNFETVSKDRRILPEKQYVYRLFAKIKKKKSVIGSSSVPSLDPILDAMCHKMELDVILPAAGSSTRMGLATPKPFIKILGSHIIAYTIDCFHRVPWVRHIVLVVSPDRLDSTKGLLHSYGFTKVLVCEGSHTRHRSIHCGLHALKKVCTDSSVVVIHDGARPFVSEDLIEKVAVAAGKHGAAGMVRPLVSTVIKGDEKGTLEAALKRSDYRNSEMPQAFQYGVINGAYEKCSEEDFDYGTECLLLALKYSQCAAELLEGNDDLWKVTYQKDIPLMETAVKMKFTKLLMIQKTSQALKCMESLRCTVEAKGLKIVSSDKEGANTIICFLDLPSTATALSDKAQVYASQFADIYGRLPRSVTRLNLLAVVIFVKGGHKMASESTAPLTSDSVLSASSSFQQQSLAPPSQLQLPPAPLQAHQEPSPAQLDRLQPQQHSYPPLALHHHLPLQQHQQQQQPFHPRHVLPANVDHSSPISNMTSPQALQTNQHFIVNSQYQYPGNIETSYPQNSYSFGNNKNTQTHIGPPTAPPYPPSHLTTQSSSLPHASSIDQGGHFHPQNTQDSAGHFLLPHCQSFNVCQEFVFSDIQAAQVGLFESPPTSNLMRDKTTDKMSDLLVSVPNRKSTELTALPDTPRVTCSTSDVDEMVDKSIGASVTEMKMCQSFLDSLRQGMKKSDLKFCLVGMLCGKSTDLSEDLVELVWGRNQFLNGQILSYL